MSQARTFPRGGVRPPDRKSLSEDQPIRKACVPSFALLPMRQHAGEPARCLVSPGERVREGMLIGRAEGPGAANVHASVPGLIREVLEVVLPSGARTPAVRIELDGEFECTGRPQTARNWREFIRHELLERIEEKGVVGLGGGQPTAAKLRAAGRPQLLLVNGVESEPYLTADHRLLVEKAAEVLTGAQIVASLFELEPAQVLLCITEDRRQTLASAHGQAAALGFRVEPLAARYPQGEEQQLRLALAGGLDALVLNVGTLQAIYEAVVLGTPLIERVVTISGSAVRRPANLKARLGTRLRELVEDCGGLAARPERIVVGGPLRGFAVADLEAPLTKEMAGVLLLGRGELRARGSGTAGEAACIGCGRCIEACPWGLRPLELYHWIREGEPRELRRLGLERCTECGCCAYVCPSRIPLVRWLAGGRWL